MERKISLWRKTEQEEEKMKMKMNRRFKIAFETIKEINRGEVRECDSERFQRLR